MTVKKISDKEVQAAIKALARSSARDPVSPAEMRAALEAARHVRKAAKKAKPAQPTVAKPAQPTVAKPTQLELRFKVGDRVAHAWLGTGAVQKIDATAIELPYLVLLDADGRHYWPYPKDLSPASVAPKWDGKFEVGKAYKTRDGRKAEIVLASYGDVYPLVGQVEGGRWPSDTEESTRK